jgi:phosphohistidine phosphatase
MAKRLVEHESIPEAIFSSDSQRTQETAKLLQGIGELAEVPIAFLQELYLASSLDIIQLVEKQSDELDTIMVLAHNPGVTHLVNEISEARLDNMPTAAIACIEFDISSWEQVGNKIGKLLWLEFPRLFE